MIFDRKNHRRSVVILTVHARDALCSNPAGAIIFLAVEGCSFYRSLCVTLSNSYHVVKTDYTVETEIEIEKQKITNGLD